PADWRTPHRGPGGRASGPGAGRNRSEAAGPLAPTAAACVAGALPSAAARPSRPATSPDSSAWTHSFETENHRTTPEKRLLRSRIINTTGAGKPRTEARAAAARPGRRTTP